LGRQRAPRDPPYGLGLHRDGAAVLSVLWADGGAFAVAVFARGPWEGEALALCPRRPAHGTMPYLPAAAGFRPIGPARRTGAGRGRRHGRARGEAISARRRAARR
jgi:hypothetical protein